MTNRIIKSLDCREIILIFCILQVDFAITVITLFVVFNESFQKALVDKSVCVINIAHLIVLSAIKNPLFDVYFNRIRTSCSELFVCYGRIFETLYTLCIDIFVCYGCIFEILYTLCIELFACYANIFAPLCTLCRFAFVLLWWHICVPPQSLQRYLYFPCPHKYFRYFTFRFSASISLITFSIFIREKKLNSFL